MQLLIILALLLYGNKNGAQNLLTEVKPVLESIGGDQMREALKSAEEISTVLSAVSSLAGANSAVNENAAAFSQNSAKAADSPIAFPLRPISNIADRDITYSLSRYVTQA